VTAPYFPEIFRDPPALDRQDASNRALRRRRNPAPYSRAVNEPLIWTVMAYIERHPVRAGLVECAEDYSWSSAVAHLGKPDTSGC